MKYLKIRYLINNICFILLLTFMGNIVSAQTNVEVFDQNRLQNRLFDWKVYETPHFKIYFYDRAGNELARYVAEQGELDMNEFINNAGDTISGGKPSVFVYNNYDQYDQTNIGANQSVQLDNHTAGSLNLVGEKILIYYNGDHNEIKKQLRMGLARLYMEKLLFGADLKSMVASSLTLKIPKWASDGFVQYVAQGWNPDIENDWKNIILKESKHNFWDICYKYPSLTGMAMWKYISMRYSNKYITNILFYSQSHGSMNKGIQDVTHLKMKQFTDSMFAFYENLYYSQEPSFQPLDTTDLLVSIERPNANVRISKIAASPHGNDVAYVYWQFGRYQVVIQKNDNIKSVKNDKSNGRNVILNGGYLNHNASDDPDYPLIAWDNTGHKLGIIYKDHDKIRIKIYNSIAARVQNYTISESRFDRITGFAFTADENKLVLSALKRGQADIFYYWVNRRKIEQVTNDIWDEKDPVYIVGGSRRGVAFLSNRPLPLLHVPILPNELVKGKMNGFFISDRHNDDTIVTRLTNETNGNISQLIPFGYDNFAYLDDVSGIRNRYLIQFARTADNLDSAYSVPLTNYGYSIVYQQYNQASENAVSVIATPDSYKVYFNNVDIPFEGKVIKGTKTQSVNYVDIERNDGTDASRFLFPIQLKKKKGDKTNESSKLNLDISNEDLVQNNLSNAFNKSKSDLKDTKLSDGNPPYIGQLGDTLVNGNHRFIYVDSTYINLRSRQAGHIFKPEITSVSLDNTVLFNRYQPFTGSYVNPSLGGLITASLLDKPEDHRLTAGVRIPFGSNGLAYYFQYENYRRRLDYTLTFFHQETSQYYDIALGNSSGVIYQNIYPAKINMDIAQALFSYPINKVTAVKATVALRRDNTIVKAIDPYYQYLGNEHKYYTTSRLEYVYDDASNPITNIWNGLKFKGYVEYMYKFKDDQLYTSNEYAATPKTGGFYNFGFDVRYYIPVHKNIIIALHGAGAHSGGNQKVDYMLGGVDNSLNPQNADFPAGSSEAYAFQALETNLRGYKQNARNGNNFLLFNSELRVPIFGSLFKSVPSFKILQNLQAIAFMDIGNAWNGFFPKAEDNVRDKTYAWPTTSNANNQLIVTVPYDGGKGTAVAWGAGLRTMLWGYFVRADYSINRSGGKVFYISLATDF